jgi:hypothetical protein
MQSGIAECRSKADIEHPFIIPLLAGLSNTDLNSIPAAVSTWPVAKLARLTPSLPKVRKVAFHGPQPRFIRGRHHQQGEQYPKASANCIHNDPAHISLPRDGRNKQDSWLSDHFRQICDEVAKGASIVIYARHERTADSQPKVAIAAV